MRAHPEVRLNQLVIYTTTQTHSLGTKAALVLGLTTRALEVSAEDGMGLRGATFQAALHEDMEIGLHPFVLSWFTVYHLQTGKHCLTSDFCLQVATVGTTSSGAIDYLPELFGVGMVLVF